MQWDGQTYVSKEEVEQDSRTASQGASRDTDRRRGRKGGENGDMTEGLITSLFKQGTTPKQTELQSRERERECDNIHKAETSFDKHEPTTASTS